VTTGASSISSLSIALHAFALWKAKSPRPKSEIAPARRAEQRLRKSLDLRRSVIAEVLAALQRIGRHPPPALLVRPEDALQSLRSAMLLGSVLPEMRAGNNAILTDLSEMVRLRYRDRRRAQAPRA